MVMDNSVVIAREKGKWREEEEGIAGIDDGGKRLDLGW